MAIAYHSWWPGPDDPFYLHASADCAARIGYYGIGRVPFLMLDGTLQPVYVYTYARIQQAYDARKAAPTPVALAVGGSFTAAQGRLRLEIEAASESVLPAGDYRLHAVLTESGLFFAGENGIDVHEHTVRSMLAGPDGAAVTFTGATPQSAALQLDLDLDPLYQAMNCEVVVFLQEAATREVFQAASVALADLPEPTATSRSSLSRIKSLY